MKQRTKIIINIYKNIMINKKLKKKKKTEYLNKVLTALLENQKKNVVDGNLEEYKEILRGKNSRNKIIDRVYNE